MDNSKQQENGTKEPVSCQNNIAGTYNTLLSKDQLILLSKSFEFIKDTTWRNRIAPLFPGEKGAISSTIPGTHSD